MRRRSHNLFRGAASARTSQPTRLSAPQPQPEQYDLSPAHSGSPRPSRLGFVSRRGRSPHHSAQQSLAAAPGASALPARAGTRPLGEWRCENEVAAATRPQRDRPGGSRHAAMACARRSESSLGRPCADAQKCVPRHCSWPPAFFTFEGRNFIEKFDGKMRIRQFPIYYVRRVILERFSDPDLGFSVQVRKTTSSWAPPGPRRHQEGRRRSTIPSASPQPSKRAPSSTAPKTGTTGAAPRAPCASADRSRASSAPKSSAPSSLGTAPWRTERTEQATSFSAPWRAAQPKPTLTATPLDRRPGGPASKQAPRPTLPAAFTRSRSPRPSRQHIHPGELVPPESPPVRRSILTPKAIQSSVDGKVAFHFPL